MLRRRLILGVAAAALVTAGCATMNVSAHIDRGANFTPYLTYDWGPPDALPTGDPRLDNNPFFRDYLMGAVEKQLGTRGFKRAVSHDAADLLVHYHASVNQRVEVYGVDAQHGYCYKDCEPQVMDYEQGTLVIDIVDARTKKVVWRGWAQDSMTGVIDDQARLERQVAEAVTKMFALFPRGVQEAVPAEK
jgi:hypothetical protein